MCRDSLPCVCLQEAGDANAQAAQEKYEVSDSMAALHRWWPRRFIGSTLAACTPPSQSAFACGM